MQSIAKRKHGSRRNASREGHLDMPASSKMTGDRSQSHGISVATYCILACAALILLDYLTSGLLFGLPAMIANAFDGEKAAVFGGKSRRPLSIRVFEAFDDVRRIDQSIDHATRYLCSAANSTGWFAYQVKVEEDGSTTEVDEYNELRHAGAIYALMDSCFFNQQQREVSAHYCGAAPEAVRNTIGWLLRETVRPVPELHLHGVYKRGFRPLTARKQSFQNSYLPLGLQGLGMIALSMAIQVQPKSVPVSILCQIGDFTLKHMQREDGTFYAFWYPASGDSGDEDPRYYSGEAALGLIYLYESLESSAESHAIDSRYYLEGAARGLDALADKQDETADHWALKATARILKHLPESRHPKLLKHAAAVAEDIYGSLLSRFEAGAKIGSSGAAASLEALFAMLPIFYENPSYYDDVEETWCFSQKVAFLLCEAQDGDKPSHMLGALPSKFMLSPRDDAGQHEMINGLLPDNRYFQIDDTQHTLSAWLSYKEALESGLSEIDCRRVALPAPVHSLFQELSAMRKRRFAKMPSFN